MTDRRGFVTNALMAVAGVGGSRVVVGGLVAWRVAKRMAASVQRQVVRPADSFGHSVARGDRHGDRRRHGISAAR